MRWSIVLIALMFPACTIKCDGRSIEERAPEKVELAHCRERVFKVTKITGLGEKCPHLYHKGEFASGGETFICKCVPESVTPEVLAVARQSVQDKIERAQKERARKAAEEAERGCN